MGLHTFIGQYQRAKIKEEAPPDLPEGGGVQIASYNP